ncbi:V-type ATP synthase subunit D [Candidatus Woesearchaeota archaeon]|nr:V-type ATP synthase subunit D [Candidatus Woesearchaeota archaeon]
MADVKPTRSELIKLKKRIKMAVSGHKLLKKKRDGLILEFFEVLKKAKTARSDLVLAFGVASERIRAARALHMDQDLYSLSLAVKPQQEISMATKNIMGTVVPSISSGGMQRSLAERGYGLLTTSSAVNETAASYEQLTEQVLLVAEVETTIRKLLDEIEKTKRRVNALEFEVIPRMVRTRNHIAFTLEEIERETTFRTKMIKRKLARKAAS